MVNSLKFDSYLMYLYITTQISFRIYNLELSNSIGVKQHNNIMVKTKYIKNV